MVKKLELLPTKADVLYVPPNRDGSGKRCGNCALYVAEAGTCVVHGPSEAIRPGAVCGYWVPGRPMSLETARGLTVKPLPSTLTGLTRAPREGTSCSSCVFFAPVNRRCVAVHEDGKPAHVEPMGCCTRWTKAEGSHG